MTMASLKTSIKVIFQSAFKKHHPLIFSKRTSIVPNTLPENTASVSEEDFIKINETNCSIRVKPLSRMPGPPAWPLIGNFITYILPKNVGRLHEVMCENHRRYGKVFKEKLGSQTNVHVSDPELMSHVFRNQGKFPSRPPFQSWIEYRKMVNKPLGLLTADGHVWYRIRKNLNTKMMNPSFVVTYYSELNSVVSDVIHRFRSLRDSLHVDDLPSKLPNELYKWAFESTGAILFETRFGCLQEKVPVKPQQFIDAVHKMNESSLYIIIGETLHRKLNTPFWKDHQTAWDSIFEIAQSYLDDRLLLIEKFSKDNEEQSGLLSHLLSCKELSMEDIYANVAEIMVGGVDTTSNTICFLLYLLSKHPRVQKKLQEEIDTVTHGRIPTPNSFKDMQYLKCVVKETLRLYPVVTMNTRVLKEKVILDGYEIPEETLVILNNYAASHDEDVFHDAEQFLPERWDRMNERDFHSFASLPFGFGARGCIGRRIAEFNLYLVISRMLQEFNILSHPDITLKPKLRTLLSTGDKLPIILEDRRK